MPRYVHIHLDSPFQLHHLTNLEYQTIVIQYDTLQAYQRHGGNMEELCVADSNHLPTSASFLAKGAIEQTLFISTRSLPPIHTT
ncbi:hypothetical protein AOCH_003482, partial [Aspergillus ochraceoroseus]